ncbi:hypothetical protein BpHYR1_023544 [Brachionus plicatilis]|uniref:Uncharacterized protein n=1 Tax=Brachionus plicatilis TaxID=10195 RepID=A0A3M7RTA1_BRAPC|nr:hypothetical protein BpHYR1_023544 [Brachionus plicatilis]
MNIISFESPTKNSFSADIAILTNHFKENFHTISKKEFKNKDKKLLTFIKSVKKLQKISKHVLKRISKL